MTSDQSEAQRRETARRAAVGAWLILTAFGLLGALLFRLLGISIPAFKLAGGLLLLLIAIDMLRTAPSPARITAPEVEAGQVKDDVAIVPLAMPLLAGAGSIATVIVLMGRVQPKEWWNGLPVLVAVGLVSAVTYYTLSAATRVERVLSPHRDEHPGARGGHAARRHRAAVHDRRRRGGVPRPSPLRSMNPTENFRRARDFLIENREDWKAAHEGFRWPALDRFNWALDWFDVIADGNGRTALHIVEEYGAEVRLSYHELAERSNRVAVYLRRHGVERGHRILMMLPNSAHLWEVMLAAMKLGAVLIPATTLLTPEDIQDRMVRGEVKHVITDPDGAEKMRGLSGDFTRIVVGEQVPGWISFHDAYDESSHFMAHGETHINDPVLLYFTSGTTAKPKLVLHTQRSYPVGHLSTMFWIGVREGDVHMNISSAGWAKHAWSCFFAPFNAGATVFVHNYARFVPRRTLEVLETHEVTTMCAPPTVWRMLILEDLGKHRVRLREALSAGEPLNPEVIEKVRRAWGLTIRDGYGQTETTAQIGNSPGQVIKPGSMGAR